MILSDFEPRGRHGHVGADAPCVKRGGPGHSPGGGRGTAPRRKFWEYRVLETIFYRRLMPPSVDPTTLKNSDFGRAKRRSFVNPLGGSSQAITYAEHMLNFRPQLY